MARRPTEAVLRPDIGIQAQFKKKKESAKYRYDRSLDPQLSWDINGDRDYAESLIKQIADCGISERAEVKAAAAKRWCTAANVEHAGEFKEPSKGVPN